MMGLGKTEDRLWWRADGLLFLWLVVSMTIRVGKLRVNCSEVGLQDNSSGKWGSELSWSGSPRQFVRKKRG